jgi:hypothetical protein
MSSFGKSFEAASVESSVFKDTFFGVSWDIVSVAILVLTVSVLRLPLIVWPHQLNPDESQMLSQAMKFLVDPVPWRAVDGTSGGPLNSYFISIFLFLGIKPGFVLVHALADVLVCLQLSIVYLTLVRIASRAWAMWGILPMVFGLGQTSDVNFLHYSSELLPGLLLVLSFHLFVVMAQERREVNSSPRTMPLAVCGLALGMTPWCKLQALPMAAVLIAAVSAHIFFRHGRRDAAFLHLGKFWLAVALPGTVILAVVAQGGALKDFWYSYILGNMAYAGPLVMRQMFVGIVWALLLPEIKVLFGILLLAVLLRLVFGGRRESRETSSEQNWVSGVASCLFFSALFAVCRPGYPFAHYAIFLFPSMTYLIVILISHLPPLATALSQRWVRIAVQVSAVCIAIWVASLVGKRIRMFRELPQPSPNASERIADEIHNIELNHPVKSIAIWGWEPGVYVLTGIPPATRDAIGHFVISLGPSHPYFRQRFLTDIEKANPDLFVDAVAKGAFVWFWTEKDGYESDPELKTYIDEHYVLVNQLSLTMGARPVRFFQRR